MNTEQQALIERLKKHVLTPLVVSSDRFWSRQLLNDGQLRLSTSTIGVTVCPLTFEAGDNV